MSNVIASLEKVLLPFAVKIGKQPHVNAIKNGFIRLMPLTLAGAMFVLINNVFLSFGEGSFFYSMGIRLDASTIETLNGLKGIGGNVYNGTLGIMSLMAPFFIGMALAEERKVDALAAGLLSVAAFMTVTPYSVGEAYAVGANWLGGANIISGIIIGLVVAEMFTFIVRRNWVIKLPDSVPASVSRSFSALIPGFIILSIMGIIAWALSNYGSNFHQIIMDTISTPLASLGSVVGWAYVIFVPLLWFFGIHGSLALTALDSGIMTPWALENISIYQQYGSVDAALEAGKTFHIWAKPMLDSYIFLGGSGATLGLIIAIFLASRRADYRQVAKLALPSGIFQINEPILFGLPIIMNPVMFIPFILVQPILAAITLVAYYLGIIPPITNIAPWTIPVGMKMFIHDVLALNENDDLSIDLFGLNHMVFIKDVLVNGTSRFAELLDGVASGQLKASTVKNIFDLPFSEGLIRSLNMLPCSYLLYYFKQKEMLAIEMGEYYKGGARAQVVQKVEKQLFDLYKNPELNVKPKELEQRGGAYYSDAACEVINAIYNDKQTEHYVNIPHHGHVENIPADWAVEMTCILGRNGATPHPRITRFDEKVLGLIHTIKGFEVAASNAALSGNFNDVLLALNLSPLVHSDRDAEVLARELILAHEKWLPNFAACIEALKGKHH